MREKMKFGVSITPYLTISELAHLAANAERLGFEYFWLHEYGLWRDVYISLAMMAMETKRIRLGTAVTNFYVRHPAITANAIADIAELSGGRAIIGVAIGGEGFLKALGISSANPLTTCREGVRIIRSLVSGDEVNLVGEVFNVQELSSNIPRRYPVPIYMAATGPRMLELAGELADGVILNVGTHPEVVKYALTRIRTGLERSESKGRSIDIACRLDGFAMSDDRRIAVEAVKHALPLVVGNAPKDILEAAGVAHEEARAIHKAYYAGDYSRVIKLITDEMVEKFTVAGTPDECRRRLFKLQRLGIEHVDITPLSSSRNMSTLELLEEFHVEIMRYLQ